MTNICRCGTYNRVRAAIKLAAGEPTGLSGRRDGATHDDHRSQTSPPRLPRSARPPLPAAGLAVGCRVPHARRADRRPHGTPCRRLNAWVVIKPDDTVVIRIARSEMGQGTLTGLAQLVAEELDCDWAQRHHRVPDPRPEPRAQPRLGQLLDRRQPRHPRLARLRPQGRRRRAHDAGAGRGQRLEGAGRRMHGRQGRHHAMPRPAARRRYGKVAAAAAQADAARRCAAEGPEGLEDRRQAAAAARHGATSSTARRSTAST